MDYFLIYLIIYEQELSGKQIKKKKKNELELVGDFLACSNMQTHSVSY